MPNPTANNRAIIIGSSIAGLVAARVLAEWFQDVVILERDRLPANPEPRRGVPQSVQPHVLLTQGYRLLTEFFPDLDTTLDAWGAVPIDWAREFRYYSRGQWSARASQPSELRSRTCSRYLLEWCVRQQLRQWSNVTIWEQARVEALLVNPHQQRVGGVKLRSPHPAQRSANSRLAAIAPQPTELAANLVVDASGRSSCLPEWLESQGYAAPPASQVSPDLGYVSRRYRIPAAYRDADWRVMLVSQEPPHNRRLGYLAQLEGETWIATLGGYGRDYPPLDDAGFLAFARSLAAPDFAEAIAAAEPLTPAIAHRATSNRRYHYERCPLPAGLVVVGDAVYASCPVYGQGMTMAARAGRVLQAWAREQAQRPPRSRWAGQSFQRRLARDQTLPWQLATGQDGRFPTTRGWEPATGAAGWLARGFNRYTDRLAARASRDPEVLRAFVEVGHFLKPPLALFSPRLLWLAGQ